MSKTKINTDMHGPWRFRLVRLEDESGVSGTGHIADGVRFADGTCVLRWVTKLASSGLYSSMDELVAIHGHGGKTVVEHIDALPTAAFSRGFQNCDQDDYENCQFSSIGGLKQRSNPTAPRYIAADDAGEYLRGYTSRARQRYGDDWRTCEFHWAPVMTLNGAA